MKELTLRKEQLKMHELLDKGYETSFIFAGTSTGKTLGTLYYIENNHINDNTLILVPNKEMKKQWADVIKEYDCKANYRLQSFGEKWDIKETDIMVIDEIHKLKGGAKYFNKVRKVKRKRLIGLTATPINKDKDWYIYMNFLGHYTSKSRFYTDFKLQIYSKKKNKMINYPYSDEGSFDTGCFPKEKSAKCESIVYRNAVKISKKGLDLKNLSFHNHEIYVDDKLWKRLIVFLEKISETEARRIISTKQIVNGGMTQYNGINIPDIYMFYTSKVSALDEVLEKYPDKPVMIFYSYIMEKEMLMEHLGEKATDKFYDFLRTDKYQYLVANAVSIGTGLDGIQLKCTKAIFFSPPKSKLDWEQFKGRIHRSGMIDDANIHRIYYNQEKRRWRNITYRR